ncbi:uncharacterized protein LOC121731176 [Aricia agestis]|uniref:uncharacterized protein LOC121731176 n=1 Tax=Aricia agestis TaxID=91739 RepID=UPI001C2015E0|nr:uncharacterized protein LOC121731176 [Aricia agestis]
MATRAVRGYRTISRDAACLLAAVHEGGSNPLPDAVRRWRAESSERSLDLWAERLEEPLVSVALIEAIRPLFKEWVNRKHGALSFHLTQMLTGHGCFGQYLCQTARRESDTRCHHCLDERDTAEHTMTTCPSWMEQRTALTAVIGMDLSLPAIIRAMLSSEIAWQAVNDFAQEVITAKEEAERRREQEALDPLRRPRRRRMRRSGRGDLH